jgi:hypothetical protein
MFDSHFVIAKLIKEHSDEYMKFAGLKLAKAKVTEVNHSKLARLIRSFEGTLVQKQRNKSISYNIHGKASPSTLWKRV